MNFNNEQINMMRQSVEIGKLTSEELLNLSEMEIGKMSVDDLALAMNIIRKVGAHLVQNKLGFDPRFQKYLARAGNEIEDDEARI